MRTWSLWSPFYLDNQVDGTLKYWCQRRALHGIFRIHYLGTHFFFKMTAIDVPVPREPLLIVKLWSQQHALHVKGRVHKLEKSISCLHSQSQQSKSAVRALFRHGSGAVPARFLHGPGTVSSTVLALELRKKSRLLGFARHPSTNGLPTEQQLSHVQGLTERMLL